jgi:hypothetical protein
MLIIFKKSFFSLLDTAFKMKKFIYFTLFIFISLSGVYAQTKHIAQKTAQNTLIYMDATQRFISDSWSGLNYGVDTFFSNQSYEKSKNKSHITVAFGYAKTERQDAKSFHDLRLRVDLPGLSKRMSATLEKERDRIAEVRNNEANQDQAIRESNFAAKINYTGAVDFLGQVDLSTGIRIDLPFNPFIKFNIKKDWKNSIIDVHIGQYLIHYFQESLRGFTRLTFAKKFNDSWSLHQDNTLSWERQDSEFILRDSLTLNHSISSNFAMLYTLGAKAKLSPTLYYNKYDYSLSFRRNLLRQWIFGALTFGSEFSKDFDWKMDHFVSARIELRFK